MFKLFTLICLCTKINGQFFGNDRVKLEVNTISNCAPSSIWTWSANIVPINITFISGTLHFSLDRNFDDSITVNAEFYQLNSKEEWKKLLKVNKKHACTLLRNLAGQLFIDITKEIGLPNGNCPVPKGQYKIDNRLIDVQKTPLGKFLVGQFKLIINGFTPKKETLFCVQFVFTTTKL